jgi:hypothetical protein
LLAALDAEEPVEVEEQGDLSFRCDAGLIAIEEGRFRMPEVISPSWTG